MIDEKLCVMEKVGANGKLSNVLKYELLAFLCYLSACDGRISRSEAQLIRDCYGLEMYPTNINDFLVENRIHSEEFLKKVPECLKIAVSVDNKMIDQGIDLSIGIGEIVIELFKVLGKAMVVADEKVKAVEQVVWGTYITTLMQYLVDNSKIHSIKPSMMPRPGTPIEVNYEMSLDKLGRVYTLFVGSLNG